MVCTASAFSLVYTQGIHRSRKHSVRETTLQQHRAPRSPVWFLLYARTVTRRQFANITYPPAHGPPTHPHCKHTVLMEQLLFVIFRVLCLVVCLLNSVLHGKKLLYYGVLVGGFFMFVVVVLFLWRWFICDCEGSAIAKLIQRKALHK